MFGIKNYQDSLIEFLQAELERTHIEVEGWKQEFQVQSELAREAVALASMAVSQLPLDKQNAKISDDPQRPRTMSAYVQRLSELSYKRAAAKGKNLVAQIPPPGAQKPNGAA